MFLDQPNEPVNEIVILLPPDSLVTPSLYISYTVSGSGVQTRRNKRGRDRRLVDLCCSCRRRGSLLVPLMGYTQLYSNSGEITYSTPAARVYMTALADEIPIPAEPYSSARATLQTHLISNTKNSLGIRNDNLPSAPFQDILQQGRTRSRCRPSHAARKSSSIPSSHSGVRYNPSLRLNR